jgi:RNA methyltransferase, TrmH family
VSAITSRRNPIVARFREVARSDASLAVIDGWHLLHEAAATGIGIELVAVAEQPDREPDAELLTRLERSGVNVVNVSANVMSALSPVKTPTGIVSLVRRRPWNIEGATSGEQPLVLAAVDIQDPGNIGAMIRSAEAGGATGAICAGMTADPWSWKALRAAMGSTFRLPLHYDRDAAHVCQTLRERGLRVVATMIRGARPMQEVDLRGPTALFLGGEGVGLDPQILRAADSRITIPMQPPVESLNVAVAAGVLVYEARRQRTAS